MSQGVVGGVLVLWVVLRPRVSEVGLRKRVLYDFWDLIP